jgi:PPK2 family polyphosphate:nucleotide phosphotransferase
MTPLQFKDWQPLVMVKEQELHLKNRSLSKFPTDGKKIYDADRDVIHEKTKKLCLDLESLQELIYAEGEKKILIILQGMDTSGKDGTIKHVFSATDPQGLRVASFKKPSEEEARHDYLWRVHTQIPAQGEIVIFNRSHYEDYVVPRVHHQVSKKHLKQRLEQINQFEQFLVNEGVTIFKFFLHISHKEQAKRIQERLDNPKKHWKFSLSDLSERRYWNQYHEAYEEVLKHTHKKHAPWYVIPADDKRIRNFLISLILVRGIRALNPKFPKFDPGLLKKIKTEAHKVLQTSTK